MFIIRNVVGFKDLIIQNYVDNLDGLICQKMARGLYYIFVKQSFLERLKDKEMQQLVEKLQLMIQNYYGLPSELELKPCHSYQSLTKNIYSSLDKSLAIPLFEPKTKHPIAFFKIYNVENDDSSQCERLYDLVQLTLQSHINMLNEMDVTESLLQYLQVELNSKKILRFRTPKLDSSKFRKLEMPLSVSKEFNKNVVFNNKDLLLLCKEPKVLDQLALEIHQSLGNHFFLRTDVLDKNFLESSEDLENLSHTTVYIPSIEQLGMNQQKNLANYMLSEKSKEDHLTIVCGSQKTITQMCVHKSVTLELLKNLNVFNILRDTLRDVNSTEELKASDLQQYAHAILGTCSGSSRSIPIETKSYHLIPSLKNLHPTVH